MSTSPLSPVTRVLAFWIGVYAVAGGLAAFRHPMFDTNLWWLDVRWFGRGGPVFFVLLGGFLTHLAIRPQLSLTRRRVLLALVALVITISVINTFAFFGAIGRGEVRPWLPLPLSLVVALLSARLFRILRGAGEEAELAESDAAKSVQGRVRAWLFSPRVLATALFFVGFPLAQLLFFGTTDYRRKADVAVVLGAKAYANGALSTTLEDRVRTGVELYRQGMTPLLIMSGGVGVSGVDETEAMRKWAVRHGVPDSAILLDHGGVTSRRTVGNTTRMFRERGAKTVLVVSQFYHLPRLQLEYQRAGYDVFTVPAKASRFIWGTPWSVIREVPSFWLYYLRNLTS